MKLLKFFGTFLGLCFGIFWEEFFEKIFLGRNFWADFLGGFFWEKFFGKNFLGEEIFGRNFLGTW